MTASIARLGLQKLGYRVAGFTDPEAALDDFGRQPEAYDLVFLDLSMPGMDGMELARRLQEIRPGLPLVLVTGTASAKKLTASAHASFQDIVTKPFTALDLAGTLRKALQSRRHAGAPPQGGRQAEDPAGGGQPHHPLHDPLGAGARRLRGAGGPGRPGGLGAVHPGAAQPALRPAAHRRGDAAHGRAGAGPAGAQGRPGPAHRRDHLQRGQGDRQGGAATSG